MATTTKNFAGKKWVRAVLEKLEPERRKWALFSMTHILQVVDVMALVDFRKGNEGIVYKNYDYPDSSGESEGWLS